MLRSADRLHAGDGDRRAPFVSACAYLPDHRGGVDDTELICCLLQQLRPVRDDEGSQSETTGGFGKHQGFAAAGGKYEQGSPSLRGALVGIKHALNTDFLIRS